MELRLVVGGSKLTLGMAAFRNSDAATSFSITRVSYCYPLPLL
jgi:hypothetical protein